ncbi:alpha/beta fold hydrolase [Streptomyces sp. SHP 1-2]|uniref:alpha/beta fold hydrolase n=1 Tax=Streptomyces sp. SHP 1-2 TaxID=2769489 RepID=UPI002237EED9|nr:alpha/beta hydrolase [Streptomyces sp. SHP 1-2]MCW5253070.1 alpha/beta fold hydrolase [Streptomyces sp. SHP 1-2]
MSRTKSIPTKVGDLFVEIAGSGPPVLLWHSMLVDRFQWQRMSGPLAGERTLVLIDGPGHGRSGRPPAGYTLEDCADAAAEVLTELGIGSVDWLGSAWGGHIGLVFAARHPERCRSVVTIATPIAPLETAERLQTRLLAGVYGRFGPIAPLSNGAADALLTKRSKRTDPEARRIVRDGLATADRVGMHRSMHAMMLRRPDISGLLPGITAPVLVIAGSEDAMWLPGPARRSADTIPRGRCAVVEGAHRLPALERPEAVLTHVRAFWRQNADGAEPSAGAGAARAAGSAG